MDLPSPVSPPSGRPASLWEVAVRGRAQGGVDGLLREFLDAFYSERDSGAREAMLSREPPVSGEGPLDAYLAAVAEHLAMRGPLPVPAWTGGHARFLRRPFFPAGLESLKATLLKESPTAFRRRMIFVGADPLYRPRRDAHDRG